MTEEYNVQMTRAQIEEMKTNFPSIEIADCWAANDWNVRVPNDDADDFIDWCEENQIECKLV